MLFAKVSLLETLLTAMLGDQTVHAPVEDSVPEAEAVEKSSNSRFFPVRALTRPFDEDRGTDFRAVLADLLERCPETPVQQFVRSQYVQRLGITTLFGSSVVIRLSCRAASTWRAIEEDITRPR